MIGRMVKLRGLNRRMLAVDRHSVIFLDENELDGNLVTNVHFGNGKWVTAALSLDETEASLVLTDTPEKEAEEDKKQIDKWKRMARGRAEAQREVDEALRQAGPDLKMKSYTKETLPDGSGKLVIFYEPKDPNDQEKD